MRHRASFRGLFGAAVALGLSVSAAPAAAQEPAACLSPDPSQWPDPSRPYFLLAVDTSGSMLGCTNPSTSTYQFPNSCPSTAPKNSCGLEPTRINDAKCALRNTVLAFSGEVNFGLLTFPIRLGNCGGGACTDSCTNSTGACTPPSGVGTQGEFYQGSGCTVSAFANPATDPSCGNTPDCATNPVPPPPNLAADWRNGGNILVPLLQDPTWGPAAPTSNVSELLKYFDARCDESKELFAIGLTPLEGILRTAQEYFISGWNTGWTDGTYCQSGLSFTYPTPIDAQDRPCRSVNIILVTDGDETCFGTATNPASQLFNNGVTIGGKNYKVRTYVIGFAGATQANVDAIAQAGGTTSALSANNETQLSQALANIIAGAIKPEVCNNGDDNCNGCTDEGYGHYCNTRPTCCAWSNTSQRTACINTYLSTNNPNNLPCTPAAMQSVPASWLCYDPGEVCDEQDNDCDGQIDEGIRKCGSPLACPVAESCNGKDDDCDAVVDNVAGSGTPFSICPNQCTPTTEVCDGCDNDCDGTADDNIAPIPCGFSPPDNCLGQATCTPKTVTAPGACATGGNTFGACQNTPQTEVCDTLDNDCDGIVNDGVAPTPCEIPNQTGLVYQDTFANSQCVKGQQPCNGTCGGWVGPSSEVCDGIDNDCDGVVDDGVTGLGQVCGTDAGPCTKGNTACVGGAVICTGGTQPVPETCNGVDDDCDGATDDAPLQDAPTAGNTGCWNLPPTCTSVCSYLGFQWCAPPGGACSANGSLAAPCAPGTLTCGGATGWKCSGGTLPETEVCDSIDNDCDGQLNDGLGAPIGADCGIDTGECSFGKYICDNGNIKCSGGQGPVPEVCNGADDNCDGNIDDGVPIGGECTMNYDRTQYPGPDRTKGLCRPGERVCPVGGGPTCINGVGPAPEVCDGKDNDCDGQTDELGSPPDGINGTADPLDATRVLGQSCGISTGECDPGAWGCQNGQFACLGGRLPQPETCDCKDNDCDGTADEEPQADGGEPPLCTEGKLCVKAGDLCQCAKPCSGTEFPCSRPTECRDVVLSSTGQPPPGGNRYCIQPNPCPDCSLETHVENGVIECAPAGTVVDGGTPPPVCQCMGLDGCRSPCFNVTCPAGQACVPSGPEQGNCETQNNCNFFGCPSGLVCFNSACIDNPCDPSPCTADQKCEPQDLTTMTGVRCVGSCATVTCGVGEKCADGVCTPTGCNQDCPPGEVCQPRDGGSFCWPSNCAPTGTVVCPSGQSCDPVSGNCGTPPCTGVVCPAGQICQDGECIRAPQTGAGGSGGTGGTGGTGGAGSGAAGSSGSSTDGGPITTGGSAGGPPAQEPGGVWGLASGGGCGCRTVPVERAPLGALLMGLALALFGVRRRGAK